MCLHNLHAVQRSPFASSQRVANSGRHGYNCPNLEKADIYEAMTHDEHRVLWLLLYSREDNSLRIELQDKTAII